MPQWLANWMQQQNISVYGAADLREFDTPINETGQPFPRAISWAIPMNPDIMDSILTGPNQAYAEEYKQVNDRINQMAGELADLIQANGFRSLPLAASVRTDTVNIKGDFPQKTAATRAGIGWIGRHCQLITKKYGPWVRLGTVFTDLDIPCGPSVDRSFCGECRACVDLCPAGALTGAAWHPGIPREEILDVRVCDQWKKEHYYQFHKGHNCGICASACPFGRKQLRRQRRASFLQTK